MKRIGYLIDEGVLLSSNDDEFECYNCVYDHCHGYFDENQYYMEDMESAIKQAKHYVRNGVDNTYAIVSKTVLPCNCNVEELPVENEHYLLESVIYSCRKKDGALLEGFLKMENKNK